MKKLLLISIAFIATIACNTSVEKASQKQSEEELRTAIVGSWYFLMGGADSGEEVIDSAKAIKIHTDDVTGRLGMKRFFYSDGRYLERENVEMVIKGDTASLLSYSIIGKWEIHGDSLVLSAKVEDIENPEKANIYIKSGSIKSINIIKRISSDSLIIQNGAQDKNGNTIDMIMLKE